MDATTMATSAMPSLPFATAECKRTTQQLDKAKRDLMQALAILQHLLRATPR